MAEGFSILARQAARPSTSFFSWAASSGRWTKDRATQSTPRRRAKVRSLWS